MKKITLFSLVTLSAAVLGATQAYAAPGDKGEIEASRDKFKTDTTITIIDNNDGEDELDPTNPTQTDLYLDSVPGSFDFSTKVSNKVYNIESGEVNGNDKTIDVFNNRIDRDWSVKATLANDEIVREADSKSYEVTEFTINDVNVTATGQPAVIAKSAETKTAENNTNIIKTAVTGISIKFSDAEDSLKAGDSLDGVINYSLYNTPNAQ